MFCDFLNRFVKIGYWVRTIVYAAYLLLVNNWQISLYKTVNSSLTIVQNDLNLDTDNNGFVTLY